MPGEVELVFKAFESADADKVVFNSIKALDGAGFFDAIQSQMDRNIVELARSTHSSTDGAQLIPVLQEYASRTRLLAELKNITERE